jgi:hypothetical protein
MDSRVVKPQLPLRTILTATFFGVLVFGFVVAAVWLSISGLQEAKMRGIVIDKRFEPLKEEQIILSRSGSGLSATRKEGEYIITVEVTKKDGTKEAYTVWLNDRARFDAVNVGDTFDVGPYLIKH